MRERVSLALVSLVLWAFVLCGGPAFAGWTVVANMPSDFYGGGAASDGTYFYVAGGYSFSAGGDVSTFYRYDPAGNTWTTLAPLPSNDATMSSAAYGNNGKIYVFGGENTASATVVNTTRIYDIATNTWSTGTPMPDVRCFMASGFYEGHVYLVGGYNTGSVSPAFLNTWAYDVTTDTWNTALPDVPAPGAVGFGGAGSGVVNGHLLVAGGRDANNTVINSLYDFDIGSGTWSPKANLPVATNVPGSAAKDGQLWIYGGGNPFAGSAAAFPTQHPPRAPAAAPNTQIYDPGADTWSTGPNLNVARSFISGANVGPDLAVAAGGYDGATSSVIAEVAGSLCQAYSAVPSTGASIIPGVTDTGNHCDDCGTTIGLPFPVALYDQVFAAAQVTSNGQLEFGGGDSNFTNTCLPDGNASYAIFPDWDDQCTGPCSASTCTGCGIFTDTIGTAPNRTFVIEWRTNYFSTNTALDYEVLLHEGSLEFDVVYGTIPDGGAGGTIGVQKGSGISFQQYSCNTASLSNGLELSWSFASCCGIPAPWTAATPIPIPLARYAFAQNGSDFYTISGVSNGTQVPNVYHYDSLADTWTPLANIPDASEAPAAAYDNGKIYVAVGSGGIPNEFDIYDIGSDTWSLGAGTPVSQNYGAAAGAYNGKVYLVTGSTLGIYDIGSNTWTTGTTPPDNYQLGGYTQVGQYLYLTGSFTGTPLEVERSTSLRTTGNRFLLAPDANSTTTMRLDMSDGSWSTGPVWTMQRGDMALASDGVSLYAIGGDATGGGFFDSTTEVDQLDLSAWPGGTWVVTPNLLPAPRQANQAGFFGRAHGGEFWSTGGVTPALGSFLADNLYSRTGTVVPVIAVTHCLTPNTSGLTASVPANAGDTYAWTITGGTIDSGQGTDTISFTSGGPATLMTLNVTETTVDGCTGNAGDSMQVNFNDVPVSNPFYTFICTIARHGITAGCGSGNFCPANNVLRSQMAVFILRGEHGSVYVPPPAVGIFGDVAASNPFAPWIEELYNESITGGCSTNPLLYCPNNSVSRAGMSVFLLVAEHGTGYVPPACTGIFTDVACPGPFTNFIEELYNEGITGGCNTNPLMYCPANSVTRAQMSVFLTVTFNLP